MGRSLHAKRSQPRILCLHGGGANARIFRYQCRALTRALNNHFHLVFAEAPWITNTPGSDVLSVYAAEGPFKVWLPENSQDDEIDDETVVAAFQDSLYTAMEQDDAAGFSGPWMGLLGFSQGGKMAASVLYETQRCGSFVGVAWHFGVLLAARAPLVALHEDCFDEPVFDLPGCIARKIDRGVMAENPERLRVTLPTIHVHGRYDPGLKLHRVMFEDYSVKERGQLVEWSGDHRIPIQDKDVEPLRRAMLGMTGACVR